jgi:hypothetical protein
MSTSPLYIFSKAINWSDPYYEKEGYLNQTLKTDKCYYLVITIHGGKYNISKHMEVY